MRFIKSISAITAAFTLSCSILDAQAPNYSVTVLPTYLPSAVAEGLNNLGEIVGYWNYNPYYSKPIFAFLYVNGTMMDLGDLIGGESNRAYDINDNGQIVGSLSSSTSGPTAFVFSLAEGVKDLGSQSEAAYAINNAGQIIGSQYGENCQCPAIFLPNGTVISIGDSDVYGSPKNYDINDYYGANGIGQVIGLSRESGFLYADGVLLDITTPVCTQTGSSGSPSSINNGGQVSGNCAYVQNHISDNDGFIYNSTSGEYPFDWTNIVTSDINDAGWLVGYYYPSGECLVYINEISYGVLDLIPSNPGITYLAPIAINNQGQIAANSNLGPVLLTPIESR